MKLAIVIQNFPPMIAGAGRQAALQARLISTRLGGCEVITTRFRSDLPPRAEMDLVRVRRLATLRGDCLRPAANFLASLFYFLLHGHRYRILHAHCLSPFTLGAIIGGKLWRRRVLLKICAIGRGGDIAKVKRQLLGRMLWRVFLKSDIFIAVTPTVAEEMLFHNVPTHKIVVIPNAVAPDLTEMPDRATRSRARAALGLHDDPIVLFVGWLLHQKGLDVLVRAWAEVVQTHRAKLVLVGGGPETERIRSWIQASGCSDSVRMFGWRSDPETFYRASDIFAFPSRSESFGNALAEAMAHGLAVVTTPVGLARHWIRDGENGILVPGDEPGLLALALRRLIEDGPLRERLGRQARADALTIFSTEAAVESFVNLYRRLDGSSVTTPC